MSKKKLEKRITILDPSFKEILVCNNKKLRPFIEVFVAEPENINQQRLGTLMGVFEISDEAEDSSYVANYLISVIKKEYFINPKRAPIESFEAALHKANLALSKLAEHESVHWIGHLNAIVAVVEKNNLHLSQAGATSAFLLRSKSFTDISEGLASSDLEPHPLKTFTNVSSGRLEHEDKLLVATRSIFDIFSFEEIKKSALRFNDEELVQFFKTALGNELEKAAVLIMHMREKEEAPVIIPARKSSPVNAFSAKAFRKKEPASAALSEELKEEIHKNKEQFTNKKTGHLYIRESEEPVEKEKVQFSEYVAPYMELPKEKSKLLWKSVKNTCRDKLNGLRSVSRMNMPGKSFLTKLAESANPRTIDKVSLRGKLEKIIPERLFRHNPVALDNKGGWKEQRASLIRNQKNAATSLLRALRANETGKKIILRALPNFSRLKNIGLQLNYQQRIYAALILIAIVAIPFLIVKYKNADPKEVTTPVEVPRVEPEKPEPLKNDLRVIKVSSLEELPESRGALQVIKVNEYIFARAGAGLVDIKSGKTFPFPPELGPVVSSAGMNDLSLIFLLGDNGTLMSFSPISLKFQSNRISIPEGSIITSMGSYLTYVYLLDSTASQIYRYPRAEGGFGEKSNWIKGESALTGITRIAVNENIFLTNQKEIFKFFKGKKQEFLLEHTETPIVPQAIYASEDGQNMYILDSINSRLVQTDTEGHILAQYYHPSMEEMKEIVIDKENNTAYLSDGNLVKVMKLSL